MLSQTFLINAVIHANLNFPPLLPFLDFDVPCGPLDIKLHTLSTPATTQIWVVSAFTFKATDHRQYHTPIVQGN